MMPVAGAYRFMENFQELGNQSIGEPPEYGYTRLRQADGGTAQYLPGKANRDLNMAPRIDKVSKAYPECIMHLLVEMRFHLPDHPVNEARHPDRKGGADDFIEPAKITCASKVKADLFPCFPFRGKTGIGIIGFDLAAGKAQIPRPGVAGVPCPLDKEHLQAGCTLPQDKRHSSKSSPVGRQDSRFPIGQGALDVVEVLHYHALALASIKDKLTIIDCIPAGPLLRHLLLRKHQSNVLLPA